MSPEKNFLHQLRNLYPVSTNEIPTPYQIEHSIDRQQLLVDLSQQSGIEDLRFLEQSFHPNGKFLSVRFKTFLTSLKSLSEQPEGARLLPFLDTKCLYKKGNISIRRLRRLRKGALRN